MMEELDLIDIFFSKGETLYKKHFIWIQISESQIEIRLFS